MKLFTFLLMGLSISSISWAGTDPELEEAQAKVARAYRTLFQQGGKPGTNAALSSSMGSLNTLLNDRKKEGENKFFGKTFDEKGNVTGNASDHPEEGAKLLGTSSDSKGRSPASTKAASHGAAHEEYVLDGSKIKKEISFGSKTK